MRYICVHQWIAITFWTGLISTEFKFHSDPFASTSTVTRRRVVTRSASGSESAAARGRTRNLGAPLTPLAICVLLKKCLAYSVLIASRVKKLVVVA
jgi:hypothetical protein